MTKQEKILAGCAVGVFIVMVVAAVRDYASHAEGRDITAVMPEFYAFAKQSADVYGVGIYNGSNPRSLLVKLKVGMNHEQTIARFPGNKWREYNVVFMEVPNN